jgi:hypothetical protein
MSAEDLEKYETEMELKLYREYRDVVPMFTYVVETERRFYLANEVKVDTRQVHAHVPLSADVLQRLCTIISGCGEPRTPRRAGTLSRGSLRRGCFPTRPGLDISLTLTVSSTLVGAGIEAEG